MSTLPTNTPTPLITSTSTLTSASMSSSVPTPLWTGTLTTTLVSKIHSRLPFPQISPLSTCLPSTFYKIIYMSANKTGRTLCSLISSITASTTPYDTSPSLVDSVLPISRRGTNNILAELGRLSCSICLRDTGLKMLLILQ